MGTNFFTNEKENTLLEKIEGVFKYKEVHFFDALVGYFRASGYFRIRKFKQPMDINPKVTYDSIYEAYWYYIGRYGCDSTINLLNVLQDHGTFIKDKS